jgi:septum formation protein
LAADTAVIIDDSILGKPKIGPTGMAMLKRLSGRSHQVLTAVALRSGDGVESRISRSVVSFREIGAAEAGTLLGHRRTLRQGRRLRHPGSGAVFVASLRGSYSGVMGLPLFETAELLDAAGVPRWNLKAP